jgi:hypothetical protein
MKKYLSIAAALMLSVIVVATAGATRNDATPGWDPAPEGHTVTFCHVAGLAEDPANTVTITADEHAVFGQAGHFGENGTPNAGHEEDYLGPCENEEEPDDPEQVEAAVEFNDGDCENQPTIDVESEEGVVYTIGGNTLPKTEVDVGYLLTGTVIAHDEAPDDDVQLVGQTEFPFEFTFDPSEECEEPPPDDPENPKDPADPSGVTASGGTAPALTNAPAVTPTTSATQSSGRELPFTL